MAWRDIFDGTPTHTPRRRLDYQLRSTRYQRLNIPAILLGTTVFHNAFGYLISPQSRPISRYQPQLMGSVEVRILQLFDKAPVEKHEIHRECFVNLLASPADRLVFQCILKSQKGHDICNRASWQAE